MAPSRPAPLPAIMLTILFLGAGLTSSAAGQTMQVIEQTNNCLNDLQENTNTSIIWGSPEYNHWVDCDATWDATVGSVQEQINSCINEAEDFALHNSVVENATGPLPDTTLAPAVDNYIDCRGIREQLSACINDISADAGLFWEFGNGNDTYLACRDTFAEIVTSVWWYQYYGTACAPDLDGFLPLLVAADYEAAAQHPCGHLLDCHTNYSCDETCPDTWCDLRDIDRRTRRDFPYNPLDGRAFETVTPVNGSAVPTLPFHDWDQDGMPDALDEVNLPSEARVNNTPTDQIILLNGLGERDHVLLVEPQHKEAHLILSDVVEQFIAPVVGLANNATANATLEAIQRLYGLDIRSLYALVLHGSITLHVTLVPTNVPASIPLSWNATVPTDGSWILTRSDPTRILQVVLGGQAIPLAPAASTNFGGDNATSFRWEFLNLHGKPSSCYDPSGLTGLTGCQGGFDLGWLRAYSGNAAYTLKALSNGFQQNRHPLATIVPNPSSGGASTATAAGNVSASYTPGSGSSTAQAT